MKQVIIWLAIWLAIYLLASGIAFGQGSAYYYYKYQDREYLARHEDRVCVKFEQGTDVGSITGELEQAGVYPESASEVGRSVYTFEIQGALEVVLQNLRQMEVHRLSRFREHPAHRRLGCHGFQGRSSTVTATLARTSQT